MTLTLRQFRADDHGPRLLVTGGVHGDEFEPILAIRRLIRLFTGDDPLVSGSVTFVPVVNENAFFRGHRCAEDGLDLARTCPGRKDGSITEKTAAALSELICASTHYIDLHTGGTELSVYPLSGYNLVSDPAVLETQRRMARDFNLPVIWGTAANLEGRSLSVARDAGVPAIYCEYLGSATRSLEGVESYFEGVLNVMSGLGMIHRTLPPSRIEDLFEDPRPGSGHMQVCHPSPIDGCFEPTVAIGDRVEKGQPLGHVLDFTGEVSLPIPADESGRIIVLRTFPRIRKGDSAGVVMPIPCPE
ncbi:MAG: succinylglutamate desuccinylase/aspartoacylase family protein [Verrucomicrobiae bacterium]|nr:succinylglutamate desuccinylase/aspartoacylase family protein [Verrucomicrobiae bacterium]